MNVDKYFNKIYCQSYKKLKNLFKRKIETEIRKLPPNEYMKEVRKYKNYESCKAINYIPILLCSPSRKVTLYCPSIILAYKGEIGVFFPLFFRAAMFHELYHQIFPEKEEREIWEYMEKNNPLLYFLKTMTFPKNNDFLKQFWLNNDN